MDLLKHFPVVLCLFFIRVDIKQFIINIYNNSESCNKKDQKHKKK